MRDLVNRGTARENVKSILTEMGKIKRTETRRKKERTANKKSVIFPAKNNPRGPSVKVRLSHSKKSILLASVKALEEW